MAKRFSLAGGSFTPLYERLMRGHGPVVVLDTQGLPSALLHMAQRTWQERVRTEYRSAQLMNQLLTELLAAGEPFDVFAGVVALIEDELRHVALCAGVVRALGAEPELPEPLAVKQSEQFSRMSPAQRALSIAISMLIVNETLSVGYIRDLAARCNGPVVADVLATTLEDESEHDAFGAQYVTQALGRFPIASLPEWRAVAMQALSVQRRWSEQILRELPQEQRNLAAHPDHDLVRLGLFSPARQALVFEHTLQTQLQPLLTRLGLWA